MPVIRSSIVFVDRVTASPFTVRLASAASDVCVGKVTVVPEEMSVVTVNALSAPTSPVSTILYGVVSSPVSTSTAPIPADEALIASTKP